MFPRIIILFRTEKDSSLFLEIVTVEISDSAFRTLALAVSEQ